MDETETAVQTAAGSEAEPLVGFDETPEAPETPEGDAAPAETWDDDTDAMLPDGYKEGDGLDELEALAAAADRRHTPETDGASTTAVTDGANSTASTETPRNEGTAGEDKSGQSAMTQAAEQTEGKAKPPDAATDASADAGPDWKTISKDIQEQEEREAAEKYRAAYQRERDAGMTDAVARIAARAETGGKDYPLTDTPETESRAAEETADAPSREEAMRNGLRQLRTLYPDMTELPVEVTRAVMGGQDAVSAYTQYRISEDAKTIAALRAENAKLKQEAANREKAVVRGVAGDTGQQSKDPWLEGFDSYQW